MSSRRVESTREIENEGKWGLTVALLFGQARSEFLFKIKFRDKQGSLRIEEKGGVDRWHVVVRKRGNRCLE